MKMESALNLSSIAFSSLPPCCLYFCNKIPPFHFENKFIPISGQGCAGARDRRPTSFAAKSEPQLEIGLKIPIHPQHYSVSPAQEINRSQEL